MVVSWVFSGKVTPLAAVFRVFRANRLIVCLKFRGRLHSRFHWLRTRRSSMITHSPLGKKSAYVDQYDASLLFPIARKIKRNEIGVPEKLPFYGYDL